MIAELERIAKLSKEEAKKELVDRFIEDAKKDAAVLVKEIEQNAKNDAEKKAKEIVRQISMQHKTRKAVQGSGAVTNVYNAETMLDAYYFWKTGEIFTVEEMMEIYQALY